MSESRLIAGAMSGTSGDGVDVALVRVSGRGLEMSAQLLHHHHLDYPMELRSALFAIRQNGSARLDELAKLGRDISLCYARAVNETLVASSTAVSDLTAIAAHGQTLYHDPPNTIQWLDPALIAAETGVAVVSDFRRADCAAGGQGAPLVPFADFLLFRGTTEARAMLNIGGIANLTYLPANCTIDQIVAFDTGPGNCVSDDLMRELQPGGAGIDVDGILASHGRADQDLVLRALSNEFFQRRFPRSTDGPAMIALFYEAAGEKINLAKMPDLLASACLFTAAAIGRAVREFWPDTTLEIFASGGGTRNRTMMQMISDQLGGLPIRTTKELGVLSEAKEAIAFALLGVATLDGVPSNVPSATGAQRSVVLGSVTPVPSPGERGGWTMRSA
jgi:anhydro-N-acetylmuramic acid kinase